MSFGTGAGKGSLPRKVDLNTYHNNYDNIFGKGDVTTTPEPKPENVRSLQEENQHLKDQLATLSTTHTKDMHRLSDMIDFRNNAIRKLRDAKGRHHTMLATRALFDIVSEECSRDSEN